MLHDESGKVDCGSQQEAALVAGNSSCCAMAAAVVTGRLCYMFKVVYHMTL